MSSNYVSTHPWKGKTSGYVCNSTQRDLGRKSTLKLSYKVSHPTFSGLFGRTINESRMSERPYHVVLSRASRLFTRLNQSQADDALGYMLVATRLGRAVHVHIQKDC